MIQQKTKKTHIGTVRQIEQVSNSCFYIEFETPYDFESAPGQYVSILCDNLTLRRPFSISFQEKNRIGVLFKEKGKGTKYIKNLSVGSTIDFIGPLGNGFFISNKKSLLVGAGIGIAPIFYLQNVLKKLNVAAHSMGGFVSKAEVPENIICDSVITNDGSLGSQGSILDYIEKAINEYKPEVIYSCGPHVVLEKVAEIAKKYSIESQVAMEKVMACGIGVCRGCVIKINSNGTIKNATVCKDGPVFKGSDVIW